jgi:hypothetical protein
LVGGSLGRGVMATKVVGRAVATAMAIAGRASRACDVCASKSARWYCGADAAYLCDRCDTQVHSANSLAQRHERARLTPAGVPMKGSKGKPPASAASTKRKKGKRDVLPPPQVLPLRKRSRTSRPHPHRRAEAQAERDEVEVTEESSLFADFKDFLVDDTHEVPTVSPSSSSDLEFSLSPEFHSPSPTPSEDSFAAYLKGKAAHDEFLVPDAPDSGIDTLCCDADGHISLAGDPCFTPGDDVDAFDDCSLSFDLAQRGLVGATSPPSFENPGSYLTWLPISSHLSQCRTF